MKSNNKQKMTTLGQYLDRMSKMLEGYGFVEVKPTAKDAPDGKESHYIVHMIPKPAPKKQGSSKPDDPNAKKDD